MKAESENLPENVDMAERTITRAEAERSLLVASRQALFCLTQKWMSMILSSNAPA